MPDGRQHDNIKIKSPDERDMTHLDLAPFINSPKVWFIAVIISLCSTPTQLEWIQYPCWGDKLQFR